MLKPEPSPTMSPASPQLASVQQVFNKSSYRHIKSALEGVTGSSAWFGLNKFPWLWIWFGACLWFIQL